MKLTIPKGWKVEYKSSIVPCHGNFGWISHGTKTITICVNNSFAKTITLRHETGHAWGIKGCSKPWCVMFEAMIWNKKWKDVWWEKVLAAVFGFFNFYRFCKKHKEELKNGLSSR